jgi:hypothetical protein
MEPLNGTEIDDALANSSAEGWTPPREMVRLSPKRFQINHAVSGCKI